MGDTWIEQREPASDHYNDLLAYFEITSPLDETGLVENVVAKRRHWREASGVPNAHRRDIARQAIGRIEVVADALLKRVPIVATETSEDVSRLTTTEVPVNTCAQDLGITVHYPVTGEVDNRIVVPRGSPIPFTVELRVHFPAEPREQVEVALNEGSTIDLAMVQQLGMASGRVDRPLPGGHPVSIRITVTREQLVRIHAFDGETGRFLCEMTVEHRRLVSKDTKAASMMRLGEGALSRRIHG